MTVNQKVQGDATVRGGRIRWHQGLLLVRGFIVTVIVGLLALFTLPYFPHAGTELVTQGDNLLDEQGALRKQLGVTVAPVNQAQLDALAREQAALREQLGVTVAPANQAQLDALVQEHAKSSEAENAPR